MKWYKKNPNTLFVGPDIIKDHPFYYKEGEYTEIGTSVTMCLTELLDIMKITREQLFNNYEIIIPIGPIPKSTNEY